MRDEQERDGNMDEWVDGWRVQKTGEGKEEEDAAGVVYYQTVTSTTMQMMHTVVGQACDCLVPSAAQDSETPTTAKEKKIYKEKKRMSEMKQLFECE